MILLPIRPLPRLDQGDATLPGLQDDLHQRLSDAMASLREMLLYAAPPIPLPGATASSGTQPAAAGLGEDAAAAPAAAAFPELDSPPAPGPDAPPDAALPDAQASVPAEPAAPPDPPAAAATEAPPDSTAAAAVTVAADPPAPPVLPDAPPVTEAGPVAPPDPPAAPDFPFDALAEMLAMLDGIAAGMASLQQALGDLPPPPPGTAVTLPLLPEMPNPWPDLCCDPWPIG